MIEKLNGITPIRNIHNSQKVYKTESLNSFDSIQLSSQAQKLSDVYFAIDAVKSTPDVRQDKINEMIKKFEDPNYIDSVLDETADKILKSL